MFRKEAVRKHDPWKAGPRTEGMKKGTAALEKGSLREAFLSERGLKSLCRGRAWRKLRRPTRTLFQEACLGRKGGDSH